MKNEKIKMENDSVKLKNYIMKNLSGISKGMELGIVSLLGFIIVIILIYSVKNNKESLLISVFIIFFVVFIVYLIISVKDYFFRSSQMREIANKYNLNYTNPKKQFFEMSLPNTRKNNIIEGKMRDKNILVYDFTQLSGREGRSVLHRTTIIYVDGRKKAELRSFFTGFGSIKKIDKFLNDLVKEK